MEGERPGRPLRGNPPRESELIPVGSCSERLLRRLGRVRRLGRIHRARTTQQSRAHRESSKAHELETAGFVESSRRGSLSPKPSEHEPFSNRERRQDLFAEGLGERIHGAPAGAMAGRDGGEPELS